MQKLICCAVYIVYEHSRIHLVVISISYAVLVKDNSKEILTGKFPESFVKKMYISGISHYFTDSI